MKSIDLDQLVQSILSDLRPIERPRGVAPSCASRIPENTPQAATHEDSRDPGELLITRKVVALAEIQDRIETLRRIIVSEKTILTPAVKDEIKKRNIEIIVRAGKDRENGNSPCNPRYSGTSKSNRIWIALHALKKVPAQLIGNLKRQYELHYESFECVLETVNAAVARISAASENEESANGVVLTSHAAIAHCVANRRCELRAVIGWEVNPLKTDVPQLGANLLIVDPNRVGSFKTQELIKSFLAAEVREKPKFL